MTDDRCSRATLYRLLRVRQDTEQHQDPVALVEYEALAEPDAARQTRLPRHAELCLGKVGESLVDELANGSCLVCLHTPHERSTQTREMTLHKWMRRKGE